MITKLYTIRDIKTDKFDSPFDSTNDATAKRYFARCLAQVPLMREHPQDFSLHACGTFDDKNAVVHCLPTIQFIASGLECSQTQQEEVNDETSKVSNDTPIQSSTESADTAL